MAIVPLYDDFNADYDRFVDWEARLSYELPFFEELFTRHGVCRVLDVACGTGHHAIALAQRDYEVVGTDLSAAMIERARVNAAAVGTAVRFEVVGFGELRPRVGTGFDVVLCLGNSLPHVLSGEELRQALADMAAVLRPGGLLILQNRNYDRVLMERQRFMPLETHREGDQEWLFLRLVDFGPPKGDGLPVLTFHMLTIRRENGEWTYSVHSAEQRPVLKAELAVILPQVGFSEVTFYGDYHLASYHPQESDDLIVVARRGM